MQAVEHTIANGLRVAAIRHPSVHTVELRLTVPFGGTDPAHAATAEMLAAVLLAADVDAYGEHAERADTEVALGRIGATLRATATPRQLTVQGFVAADGLGAVLRVLGSVLADPRRPADVVDTHRTRLIHRLRAYRAQPNVAAREAMFVHCFPGHPLTREVPSPDEVARVQAGHVLTLHTRALVPAGARLLLVGALDPAAALATAERALRPWENEGAAVPLAELPAPAPGVSVHSRPGGRQAQIRILTSAPRTDEPHYAAALLANLLLGGYPGSRLHERLRERDGLTYSVASWNADYPGRGIQVLSLDTAPHQVGAALAALREELERLTAQEPADVREIAAARGYELGVTVVRCSTQRGIADTLDKLPMHTPLAHWLPAHLERVKRTSDADVIAAARHLGAAHFGGIVLTAPSQLDEATRAAEKFLEVPTRPGQAADVTSGQVRAPAVTLDDPGTAKPKRNQVRHGEDRS